MNGDLSSLLILAFGVFLLLWLHARLVLCEISLVKIRYGEAEGEDLEKFKEQVGLAGLLEQGDLAGRVVRFGKTLCLLGYGLLLMSVFWELLAFYGKPVQANYFFSLPTAFFVSLLVHVFFAEILPRGAAMRDPVKGLKRSYRVLLLFRWLTMPIMQLLRRMKHIHFERIGVELEDELNPLDVDVQIRAMGEDSSSLSPLIRKIMDRTLQMQELVVHDVLLPRNNVVIYDIEQDFKTNLEGMKGAGHTRFPICRGDLDSCLGIIHIKDIFRWKGGGEEINPLELKRSIAEFPQETPLEEALQRMLRAKFHMALVTDEFGRVIGLVTLESILESLVGDIQDEFDSDEKLVVPLSEPDTYRISGLTPLHDLEETLGLLIENEEVSTIGGLVTTELGYIPSRGECLSVCGMNITIIEVDERRVITVRVTKEQTSDPEFTK